DDYQRLFGVKCRVCAGYVVGEVITALGSTFHPSCFRCQTCRTPFTPGDRVTLWSNELYLCKACSHRERLKDEAASDTDPAGGLRVGTAPPTAAAAAVTGNGAFDANTDTGYTTESTGHGLRSLPQHQHYPPQHYHHYHYLADGSSIRGGGHHSPGSFSCPSEASSSRRSRWGSQLARSYLTLEQEAERKLHPNDRYHRPASPCAAVASSTRSPSPQPQHFHLPMHRDGSRPRSRAHSLASSSRGAGTHPGSIGPRRPASVAGGGRPGRRGRPARRRRWTRTRTRCCSATTRPAPGPTWPSRRQSSGTTGPARRCPPSCWPSGSASADERLRGPPPAPMRQPPPNSSLPPRPGAASATAADPGASSNPAGWSSAASAPPCCSARTIRSARRRRHRPGPAGCSGCSSSFSRRRARSRS
ncbi:hypothetical protein BOX15_Mlig000859g7, partial [Macrostomum lignano]